MVKKVGLWSLVICHMWLIFSFSAQNSSESNELSNSLLDKIIGFFAVNLGEETWGFLSVFIRKVAHFSIYMVLGILIFLLVKEGCGVIRKKSVAISVLSSGIYAMTDEVHQLFVPGRSGQVKDVFIDTLGATVGVLVLFCIYKIRGRKND